ncbi:LysR family transcriptional regulator [bacterium]|nr:MAG: LysR family transcriptional regulator [bacterium]
MELRHIKYFLAVAEERSFTRAAQKVGIGQPPLSQQIRDLEREVGTPLFRRLPRGAELTDAGRAFLPEAEALLEQSKRAIQAARRGARGEVGRLRVGYTSSATFSSAVPATVRAFRRKYPDVELSLSEANTSELLEKLATKELDAAFLRPGKQDPEGVRIYNLASEAMFAVLPSSHPLARAKTVELSALAKEVFMLFPRSAGMSLFDEIITACQRAGFEPILGQSVPQISSVGNLVAAEMGISIVPEPISQVKVAGVSYVPLADLALRARLALAIRPDETSGVVYNFAGLLEPNNAPEIG